MDGQETKAAIPRALVADWHWLLSSPKRVNKNADISLRFCFFAINL